MTTDTMANSLYKATRSVQYEGKTKTDGSTQLCRIYTIRAARQPQQARDSNARLNDMV